MTVAIRSLHTRISLTETFGTAHKLSYTEKLLYTRFEKKNPTTTRADISIARFRPAHEGSSIV